ncbi:MAG: hypothetical protein WDZ52_08980 [Pseudohongiellaceae bacterium]
MTIKNKTCLFLAFCDSSFIFVHKLSHQTQFLKFINSFITVFIEVFQPLIPFVHKGFSGLKTQPQESDEEARRSQRWLIGWWQPFPGYPCPFSGFRRIGAR